MLLFLLALVIMALAVAGYAHYNPGVHEITMRNYHFAAVPDWIPVAVAAAVPLFFFLVHALHARGRARR